MNQPNFTLSSWQRLSGMPTGKWAFSRLVCWKAPFFATIRPMFIELRPGHALVRMKKRRAVHNHIGTVHAIAMCNLAELAAGVMSDATVPVTHRWIPKGMTVEYLKKAETDLTAVAEIEPIPQFGAAMEVPVKVAVMDKDKQTVLRAVISMWVTPKK